MADTEQTPITSRRRAHTLLVALTLTMAGAVGAIAGIPQQTSATRTPATAAAHVTQSATRHWQDD
jgi:hypothetical protein